MPEPGISIWKGNGNRNVKTGSTDTRLIVLRGNSASGKSAAARCIRERFGRGIAIVGQDNLRRDILKERDLPGAANIGLIDLTARYALDHGYHAIVEGILQAAHYREMLRRLMTDHRGESRLFYFDVSFAETVRRHATKPQAVEYGAETMRNWFQPHDVLDLPGIDERIIPEDTSLEGAVSLIMGHAGWSTAD
jgi:predicted kinase